MNEPVLPVSLVIPAKNEEPSLSILLPRLKERYRFAEIIVVDDGSTDGSKLVCERTAVRCVSHPYSKGNGAAIKTGARVANHEVIVFMDADGQHDPDDIPRLLEKLDEGYDMVIGARRNGSQASLGRSLANRFYNRLASYMTGHKVEDLTSGFRAVRADKFREFLYLLPNGFSYPTTITMAFFRAGHSVRYVPIVASKRSGRSHVHPLKDGIRFLLIIFKIGSLYSLLKLFAPLSLLFMSAGFGDYVYTFTTEHRFTNMSALLLSTSVLIFLIGLVSEQITMLIYKDGD